ncbi:MAG TPA: AI-2E family transporter [Chloroflexota bacterium]|nr:AI-2E family transporter [Chloroflexota bacterium]
MERIRDPWLRALTILLVLIAGLYLAGMVWSLIVQFADILILFFFGWLVAFMLEPAVAFAQERRGLPRPAAVAVVYLALLATLVGIAFWLVPALVAQLIAIAQHWPIYVENATAYALTLHQDLASRGFDPYPEIWGNYQELLRRLEALGPPLLANVLALARGAAAVAMDVVIVLVLSVYLMLDTRRITHAALRAVPANQRDDLIYFMESVRRAFGGFLRGQLVLGALYGLLTAGVMSVAGLDFTLVASVFAGLVMLIPFLGPILAVIPPTVIALLLHPDRVWWIVIVLVAGQCAVLNVASPRVMSQTVGMHPLLVFVAVLLGAKVAGLWGALFGVPIAGVVVAMVAFYRLTLEERRLRAAAVTQSSPVEAPEDCLPLEEPALRAPG